MPEPFRSVMCCKGMNLFSIYLPKRGKKVLPSFFFDIIYIFFSQNVYLCITTEHPALIVHVLR